MTVSKTRMGQARYTKFMTLPYNPMRNHTNSVMLSPVDYKMKQQKMNEANV